MTSDSVTINGQEYSFIVQLVNPVFSFNIPYSKVIDLTIVESLFTTFPYGELLIDNSEDLIENYTESGTRDGKPATASYRWTEDGNDLVHISIRPLAPNRDQTEQVFPAKIYEMTYIFSIVSETSISTTTNKKAKKLSLLDVRELALLEKNTQWSTNTALVEEVESSINLTQKSNSDRKVKTGIAIKNFLKTTLGEHQKFTKGWDAGKTKVFYSSPGVARDMTTLITLLDSHVSENSKDNCLLRCERDGTLSFASYEDYYTNALTKVSQHKKAPGKLLIDAFSLPYQSGVATAEPTKEVGTEAVSETYDTESPDFVPPASRMSYDIGNDVSWSDFEGVQGFSYSNFYIPGSVTEFASLQVHSRDAKHKQFNIENKNSHIENVIKDFQKLYVDHFHGQSGKAAPIYPVNTLKLENKIVNHTYTQSDDPEYRIKVGRNTLLSKAVSFCPGITLELPGATQRIPGRFISLFGTPAMDTQFQDRIQGEWFIANMVHTFKPGKYSNTITCTKHYSFK